MGFRLSVSLSQKLEHCEHKTHFCFTPFLLLLSSMLQPSPFTVLLGLSVCHPHPHRELGCCHSLVQFCSPISLFCFCSGVFVQQEATTVLVQPSRQVKGLSFYSLVHPYFFFFAVLLLLCSSRASSSNRKQQPSKSNR